MIAQINQEIARKEDEAREILVSISELEIPSSGNAMLFRELYEEKRAYLAMIDACRLEIAHLKEQRAKHQEKYKQQNMEFEKMQYLFRKETQERLSKLKAKERKELDEIAMMQFKKAIIKEDR